MGTGEGGAQAQERQVETPRVDNSSHHPSVPALDLGTCGVPSLCGVAIKQNSRKKVFKSRSRVHGPLVIAELLKHPFSMSLCLNFFCTQKSPRGLPLLCLSSPKPKQALGVRWAFVLKSHLAPGVLLAPRFSTTKGGPAELPWPSLEGGKLEAS